ncbi:hypothetical protein ACWGF3_17295 [Streptomyces xanthophaeus]|uniref:Uncharacterized protein n=1 Tax=Streptomyces xanthophaeus TaxID=67385 RepID=A0A919LGD5_9ACTN|nr:hypothetical protein [Streptomyces xanthophaeus]WST20572.1 hypothetical protein OG264_03085 [Streptomyces xanthophaeus]WST64441.1 hypothetical protein OG605_35275 [Streptomyces xanthophaeus]GHI83269.1 hypothetical protein Sxan_06330 [Streptomyces xanthophaeus]
MTDQEKSRRRPRTTPSEAVGESGDREARQQADEAVSRRSGEGGDPGKGEARGGADAHGHAAKRQSPGIGREEQARPDDAGRKE